MTSTSKDYFMLIKVGKKDHIEALHKKGHLHCNTIRYFRTVNDGILRGDPNEGKSFVKQMKDFQLENNNKIIVRGGAGQMYYDDPNLIGNVFCLYGVESDLVNLRKKAIQKIRIEEETKGFGEYALIIHDPIKFKARVVTELKNKSIQFQIHRVRYYDSKTYEGGLDQFDKSDKYEYQKEIRLWIPNNKQELFELYIGDISDISFKCKVEGLDQLAVDVTVPEE